MFKRFIVTVQGLVLLSPKCLQHAGFQRPMPHVLPLAPSLPPSSRGSLLQMDDPKPGTDPEQSML